MNQTAGIFVIMQLTSAALHLTYVCANRCRFCYVGDLKKQSHPEFSDVSFVISSLARAGLKDLLFVGGDPCTFPFLKDAVKLASDSGLRVHVLSNSLEFGRDLPFFIERLSSFEATILGATAENHDNEAARPGAFRRLMDNLHLINKAGRSIDVVLTLHHENAGKVEAIVENLLKKENISIAKLVIQRVIPLGQAGDGKTPGVTISDIPLVFEALHRLHGRYALPIDFEDPFPLCLVPAEHRYLQTHGCLWGINVCSVNSSGALSRCGADARFSLGNLREIANLQSFWKTDARLQSFRNQQHLPQACRDCDMLATCGGGCCLSSITAVEYTCDALLSPVF